MVEKERLSDGNAGGTPGAAVRTRVRWAWGGGGGWGGAGAHVLQENKETGKRTVVQFLFTLNLLILKVYLLEVQHLSTV